MKRIVPKIQVTKNYDLFRISPENRSIDKIKKLVVSMKQHGFLPSFPLAVVKIDGNLYVKDGQHRLETAKTLGLDVYYVVLENTDIDIAAINNAQKPWSVRDYISSFANQGKDHYQHLLNFCDHHKLPVSVGASLLIGNQGASAKVGARIKCGSFTIKSNEFAERVAKILVGMAELVPWAKRKNFVDAVSKCVRIKEFYGDAFLDKARKNPGLLQMQPTSDAYLAMIERVYNHCSRNPSPIKFLAEQAAKNRSPIKRSRATPQG